MESEASRLKKHQTIYIRAYPAAAAAAIVKIIQFATAVPGELWHPTHWQVADNATKTAAP